MDTIMILFWIGLRILLQTIKALIINGASLNTIRFPKNVSHLRSATAGHGFVDIENTLFSDDNSPTLILEDTIKNSETKLACPSIIVLFKCYGFYVRITH